MAEASVNSQLNRELDGQLQSRPVDSQTAKKAIAKSARLLRGLLDNHEERIDTLVKHGLLERKDTKDVIRGLKEKIGQRPSLLWVLISQIKSMVPEGEEAARKLQQACCAVADQKAQAAPTPAAVHDNAVLHDLKKQIQVLRAANSTDDIIQAAVTEAVTKELKLVSAEQIKEELSRIHQKGLISSHMYKWAITKILKENKPTITASTVDGGTPTKQGRHTPVELSNDDLYHASLCSTVVNKCHIIDAQECKRLLQSSSYRPLIKFAVNQSDDRVVFPKCMIAIYSNDSRKSTTCYIAFADFKFQPDTHNSTFGNVCECQIERFPTAYLEKVIKETDRLVLTGFSFGGVLAQILTAQLWLQPLTNIEMLKSNVICITFGQPLIQCEQLSHATGISPDFKDNTHTIYLEDDSFPSIAENLDSLNSTNKVKFENLLYLQECCLDQRQQPASTVACPQTSTSTPNCEPVEDSANVRKSTQRSAQSCSEKDGDERVKDKKHQPGNEVSALNPGILEPQNKFELLFKSQCKNSIPMAELPAKRHLIVCDESGPKVVEVKMKESSSEIDVTGLQQHSAGTYFKSIKTLVADSDSKEHKRSDTEISDEFVCPIIEHLQITQYENEAIIVMKGQNLWFVHSIKLLASSVITKPFQIQPASVSFKVKVNTIDIPGNQEESQIVVFSHFHLPVEAQICVQVDVNGLSPRCRQLARLEPADLLETAFMTSLLERCRPCPASGSSENQPIHAGRSESSPFFSTFKRLLHQLATIAPFESMLCAIAQCSDKQKAESYICILKQLGVEFPFSLTMYVSLFNIIFKIQHRETIKESLFAQLPFEVCAYFTWLTAKHKYATGMLPKAAVDSFSEEVFTDRFMFVFLDSFCSDSQYLRKMVQDSLKQVSSLSEVEAVSSRPAADLYNLNNYARPTGTSASKHGQKSLKSPIKVVLEAREALHQSNDGSALQETNFYERTLKVLHNARYVQIDMCINILCAFIHQHIQVPFTEVNPVNLWKRLLYLIAPYSDVFKSESDYWSSMLKRCQRAISKGSEVADRTYHDKLTFLVNNIDPETKAQTTSAISEYTLEKKLKEICSRRGIDARTSVEQMVHAWQVHFKDCQMAKIVPSYHSLISRWTKWSLMIHELRLTLEKHITIAIPGLVNSGKTQLIRSLFGFNVKAGTTEQRRTIVPFMYSLSPNVEGVHVVDLPGADDSDKNVLQFTEFLNRISQVVIFVVSYDKAHSKDAIECLSTFEKKSCSEVGKPNDESDSSSLKNEDSRPVLVCMTFADRLLAEMMDKDGRLNIVKAKTEVKRHFEEVSYEYYGQSMWSPAGPNGKRTLGCYCFDLSHSVLCEGNMRAVNIGVPSDVGDWLCQQLREDLCACDIANQLEAYFKKSCSKI